jgi:alkylation response protein AidB-like acyl-CoA dehydrogenase
MDFGFTQEQEQLRAQVRRLLDAELPLDRILAWSADPRPLDRALWKRTAELGWPGMTVPEEHGGLGLGCEDLIVVLEEMGKSVSPLPLLATDAAVAALRALGSEAQCARYLPAIAAGECVATIAILEETDVVAPEGISAHARPAAPGAAMRGAADSDVVLDGAKLFVPDAQHADLILVAAREDAGVSLFAVPADAPGVRVTPLVVVDATKPAAEVHLEQVHLPADARLGTAGAAWSVITRVLDRMTIGLAAEMVGAADAALAMAVEYAKVRRQFGSPIGRFQGVKHRCAELLVDIESARSLVYYGAWAVEHDPAQAASYAAMAKAAASEALDAAGEECIQIHGAIGYTWECHAHLFYKRGRHCHVWMGAPDEHYERVLALQERSDASGATSSEPRP